MKMNLEESLISEHLATFMEGKSFVIVNVKPLHLTKSNLILIKALADIDKKRGLVITLERPHHYLTYLLGIQGINQRNITYVDLAYSKTKKIKFPIKITGKERHLIGGFISGDSVNLKNFEFVMIDNVSTARMYMARDSLFKFVHYLADTTKKAGASFILSLDASKEEDLINSLNDFQYEIINFEEVMKNGY